MASKRLPRHLYKKQIKKAISDTLLSFSNPQVQTLLMNSRYRNFRIRAVDGNYFVLPAATLELILERSSLDELVWTPDRFDCDDFAICLKAEFARQFMINSVGIVYDWSGKHAYSAAVIYNAKRQLELRTIEPQSDKTVKMGEAPMYAARAGLLIF